MRSLTSGQWGRERLGPLPCLQAGQYTVSLLVGDPTASEVRFTASADARDCTIQRPALPALQGLKWELGSLELLLPAAPVRAPPLLTAAGQPVNNQLPIIRHIFVRTALACLAAGLLLHLTCSPAH